MATSLGFAPGEEALVSFSVFFRYGNVWTDWRKTGIARQETQEKVLELAPNEHISHISGLSYDIDGSTYSLMAETSASQRLEPYGVCEASLSEDTPLDGVSWRFAPSTIGKKLNHISGDQTMGKYILR